MICSQWAFLRMIGQVLGNYRVVSELPAGDLNRSKTATVRSFVVVHEQTRSRGVLVLPADLNKIPPFFANLRQLFLVRDPGFAEILDTDQLPDGTPYFIREHLEGETLRQRVGRFGRLPELSALHLTAQIAGALQAAHRKGVAPVGMHPDRVILISDPAVPSEERVKLVPGPDASSHKPTPASATPTATGSYLAPEQHVTLPGTPPFPMASLPGVEPAPPQGGSHGAQSDVFTLGLLLYEMLTGWHPLGGLTVDDPSSEGRVATPPRTFVPTLRDEVERLVLAMLARDPEKRPNLVKVQGLLAALLQRPHGEGRPLYDSFGRYRVVSKLGEGGMGTVFQAISEDTELRVAIKVLHPELSDLPQIMTRFCNEARTANRVRHPGVVTILELGQQADRPPYIVMEYLDGESLAMRMAHRGAAFRRVEALWIFRQLAEVMAAAHDKGVIHRDIKPENVMIIRDPFAQHGERVKILDFGVAKMTTLFESRTPDAAATEVSRTKTGIVLGTPLYMAPEQCRGASTLTDKVDVYALGVIFYQALCGKVPFLAESPGDVMAMHLHTTPTPLTQLIPTLSREVEALVLAMLSKVPADRPTMKQVAKTIRFLEEQAAAPLSMQTPLTQQGLSTQNSTEDRPRRRLASAPRLPDPPEPKTEAPPPPRSSKTWVSALLYGLPVAVLALGLGIWLARTWGAEHREPVDQRPERLVLEPPKDYPKVPKVPERTEGPRTPVGLGAVGPLGKAAEVSLEWKGKTPQINAIWGTSSDDLFAVGAGGTVMQKGAEGWRTLPCPTDTTLTAIWGHGRDIFIVGEEGTILHTDRQGPLHKMKSPGHEALNAVWGTRWNHVFAAGRGAIFHYDGKGWQRLRGFGGVRINGIWGTSDEDIFAVGAAGVVLRYDGRRFVPQTVPVSHGSSDKPKDLLAIDGTGPKEIYAMGEDGLALRYDGTGWNLLSSEVLSDMTIYDLHAQAENKGVYGVGFGSLGPMLISLHGKQWSATPIRGEVLRTLDRPFSLFALHSAGKEGSPGTLYLGGRQGVILKMNP